MQSGDDDHDEQAYWNVVEAMAEETRAVGAIEVLPELRSLSVHRGLLRDHREPHRAARAQLFEASSIERRARRRVEEVREAVREHAVVRRIVERQGKQARYRDARKNLFDPCRTAAVINLEAAHRELAKAA